MNFKHGMIATPEYRVWSGILTRCTNANDSHFPRYGGRGITICGRWLEFSNFYADMGPRPSAAHSIDRFPDNDGNYEPNNCRWATMKEQSNNRCSNRRIEFNGEALTIAGWADRAGLSRSLIRHRLAAGWSVADALQALPGSTDKGITLRSFYAKLTAEELSAKSRRGWATRRSAAK